jgi:Tfp pilus assembly pilus retraction ATPase PilT
MPAYKEKLSNLSNQLIAQGASDLHLGVGCRASYPRFGRAHADYSRAKAHARGHEGFIDALLTPEHKKRFLATQGIDFSYAYGDKARFRGNAYFERGRMSVSRCGLSRA